MEEVDFILNGNSTSKVYGLKSISVGEPFCRSEFMAMPVINAVDEIFMLDMGGTIDLGPIDVTPKTMRMLFGNHVTKPPKQVVCRFKLKNRLFARPVYITFIFPKASVDTKAKLKSISDFVKACYK